MRWSGGVLSYSPTALADILVWSPVADRVEYSCPGDRLGLPISFGRPRVSVYPWRTGRSSSLPPISRAGQDESGFPQRHNSLDPVSCQLSSLATKLRSGPTTN